MSNLSKLIKIQDNSYYFKSDAISVYPCAYRGADDNGKYFNPASRYTSEKNITSATVGLVPNGTYISDVPTDLVVLSGGVKVRKIKPGLWKFTIGGYNFEAQLEEADLTTLKNNLETLKSKEENKDSVFEIRFEICPRELPNDTTTDDTADTLTSLGKVLTSYETTDNTASQLSILDQKIGSGSDYCFTGLKVTIITVDTTTDETSSNPQPTSIPLVPVLYTTIDEELTLVLNQYARLPEITHGRTEGEAEVTKLNVLENITLANADAYDLLVENQLVVGTNRDANNTIFRVTLNRDGTGAIQQPSIEVKTAPITVDKAPVTVNSAPVIIKADSNTPDAIVLAVEGSAGVTEDLTVTKKTTTEALSVANGNFEVNSSGGTTIKNNLETTGTLAVTAGTTLKSTLDVAGDMSVNTNKFTVDAEHGNTAVAGMLNVTGDLKVNTNKFEVNAASGNTTIAGTLGVGPSDNLYLNITVTEGTGKTLTEVGTNSLSTKMVSVTDSTQSSSSTTGALTVTGGVGIAKNLNVGGNLAAKTTTIAGNLTIKDPSNSNSNKFKVENAKTTIATATTEINGTTNINSTLEGAVLSINTDKFSVNKDGNTTIAGTLDIQNNLMVKNGDTEKFKVESSSGKTTINGALEVNGTPVNLGNNAIVIGSNLVTINRTTQVNGVLTANSGLQVVNEGTFNVSTEGNLTAKSVTTDTLNVPNHDSNKHTSLSLGPKIVNDDGVTTRSFYFKDEGGTEEYIVTPTTAKAALLNMIYPVGSIYMTMENLATGRSKTTKDEYAIFDPKGVEPSNATGGLWKRISQGRVLLGAGSSFGAGATGGYYNPQPWAHWHKYNKARGTTDGYKLLENDLPRKDFELDLLMAVSGGDNEKILRYCYGTNLDGAGDTYASDSGSNARIAATQVYTGGNKFRETRGYWQFHYGADLVRGRNQQKAHSHGITLDSAFTSGCYDLSVTDPNTQEAAEATQANGNLPPYLVCYIWQRTK